MGLGKLRFAAWGDYVAVEQMQRLFHERLEGADYARLTNEAGEVIWESKGWDA